jgi:hypothetical protein
MEDTTQEDTTQTVLDASSAAPVPEGTGALPLPEPELKPERVQKELLAVLAAAQARRVRGWGWKALPAIGGLVRVKRFGSPRVAAMYGLFATENAALRQQRVTLSFDGLGQVAILLLQVPDHGLSEMSLQYVKDLG